MSEHYLLSMKTLISKSNIGEFSNWYVYTIYADTFVNPFINELDKILAIVITQNISEEENKDVDVL